MSPLMRALRKIQELEISSSVKDVRVVVALIYYNPKSRKLDLGALKKLPFASQVDLFFLGFGIWHRNSQSKWP